MQQTQRSQWSRPRITKTLCRKKEEGHCADGGCLRGDRATSANKGMQPPILSIRDDCNSVLLEVASSVSQSQHAMAVQRSCRRAPHASPCFEQTKSPWLHVRGQINFTSAQNFSSKRPRNISVCSNTVTFSLRQAFKMHRRTSKPQTSRPQCSLKCNEWFISCTANRLEEWEVNSCFSVIRSPRIISPLAHPKSRVFQIWCKREHHDGSWAKNHY